MTARPLAAALLSITSALLPGPASAADPYAFLAGTKWYVPAATLPAVLFDPAAGTFAGVGDQTVWAIDGYQAGYFRGRAAVLLTQNGKPAAPVQCMRLLGSVAPGGSVHVSFVPVGDDTAANATTGTGRLALDGNRWRFLMQMASGTGKLVAHWSYMDQCRPGQPCQSRLPGTNVGLDALLARCGG